MRISYACCWSLWQGRRTDARLYRTRSLCQKSPRARTAPLSHSLPLQASPGPAAYETKQWGLQQGRLGGAAKAGIEAAPTQVVSRWGPLLWPGASPRAVSLPDRVPEGGWSGWKTFVVTAGGLWPWHLVCWGGFCSSASSRAPGSPSTPTAKYSLPRTFVHSAEKLWLRTNNLKFPSLLHFLEMGKKLVVFSWWFCGELWKTIRWRGQFWVA